ncbi:MAG: hypothetical protein IJ580_10105 [Prevotella sp.]|nr:hypothetical protein [Prevotella sp.]MBR1557105.1 hypothetical protein [Prevotella sp.]
MGIKKYIEIPEESLVGLSEGRFVEGSLHRDKDTGRIVFNAYRRTSKRRKKDILLAELEHGWLKESAKRVKFYCALKKSIGTARIIAAMEREQRAACGHLIDREIIDRV